MFSSILCLLSAEVNLCFGGNCYIILNRLLRVSSNMCYVLFISSIVIPKFNQENQVTNAANSSNRVSIRNGFPLLRSRVGGILCSRIVDHCGVGSCVLRSEQDPLHAGYTLKQS